MVQARVRGYLARINFRRRMFGVICIFTFKTDKKRIRVTVKKVELKQTMIEKKTKTEHKRHHKGGDFKVCKKKSLLSQRMWQQLTLSLDTRLSHRI